MKNTDKKNTDNMTNEQKKTYYVIRSAKIASEEYKLKVGTYLGVGLAIANVLFDGVSQIGGLHLK